MVALNSSGTQTATLTTEHTLGAAITTVGVFQFFVDTTNLANGETLTLRIYYKVLTGGAEGLALPAAVYVNAQTDPIKFSLPMPSDISIKYTLRQDSGTGRAFPWKVLSL